MNSTHKTEPAKWFKPVVILAVVWNAIGIAAFVNQTTMDVSALPEAHRSFYLSVPLWATIAFAVAVFMGTIGSIGLLMRKSWSVVALALSALGIVVQMFHSFVLGNALAIFGSAGLILPAITLTIGLALLALAVSTTRKSGS